jgi:hypothetical protein
MKLIHFIASDRQKRRWNNPFRVLNSERVCRECNVNYIFYKTKKIYELSEKIGQFKMVAPDAPIK